MRTERVVVTGAGGVIGRALVQALEEHEYTNVYPLRSTDVDLSNVGQTDAAFADLRPDLVFHLAARVYGIMGNMANKAKAYLDNIRINTNVVEAAQASGARKIVAMGSTAIYSDAVSLPMRESDIFVGAPHPSEAAYAHTKRSLYAHLQAYNEQYGLKYAYAVSTNLYGPHDKFDENWGHVLPSLVSKFHRAVNTGTQVSIWGDGTARRDFLYSKDASSALLLIADEYEGAINLASGSTQTIKQTVDLLASVSGYTDDVVWDTTKPNGQKFRDYDVSKLVELGFTPRWDLERGLKETYTWFAANSGRVRT